MQVHYLIALNIYMFNRQVNLYTYIQSRHLYCVLFITIYGIIVQNWVNFFPCGRDVEIQLVIVCVVINYKN